MTNQKYKTVDDGRMKIPPFELLDWLLGNEKNAKYDFGISNIPGLLFSELQELTGYEIPADFDLGKNDHFGEENLRNVLAGIYDWNPENIVTATGGSEANFLSYLAIIEAGDEVIVENPGYEPMYRVPAMLGGKIVKWERKFDDDFRLDLDELNELISHRTKLLVLTNLHNPSGVLTPRRTMEAVAEIARDNGASVLIDEMFLDASNFPCSSAAGIEGIIITSSVTKLYGLGGFRTGWIIAEKETAKSCQQAKSMASAASPYLSELISKSVLLTAREKLLDRFKIIANRNMAIVKDWMEERSDILEFVSPAGGIMCFPRYTLDMDSATLGRELLDKTGVLVSPGKYFGLDGHFRLTAVDPEEEVKAGLAALGEGLNEIVNK